MAALAGAATLVAAAMPATAHAGDPGTTSAELRLVGRSALGHGGLNAQVAVVGTTAVVGSGINPSAGVHASFYNPYPCPATRVKLVDLSTPSDPKVVGTIPVGAGQSALDVDAKHVSTPSFTGDLAAIALSVCGGNHNGQGQGGNAHRGVAYYDITHPAAPTFLGRYLADSEDFPPDETCGREFPKQHQDPGACASSQHSVSLAQRPDGKVISVSTEPFATASGFPSGDMRIVDVTDPRNPVQVASAPADSPGFSANGCRPFGAGHDAELYKDGTRALLADLDNGLFNYRLSDPTNPTRISKVDPYPPTDRTVEGNGAYATAAGPDQNLALLSDEDWVAPTTSVRIDSPATSPQGLTAGSHFGCEAMFTLFDPEDTAQIYRHPGSQVAGQFAYIGRACPVNTAFGTTTPDPFLTDRNGNSVNPAGKIAVLDGTRQPLQRDQLANAGSGCSLADKAKRAQDAGAIGVVINRSFFCKPPAAIPEPATGCTFSFDGDPRVGGGAGLTIPVMGLDNPAVDQLRDTLCPGTVPNGSGVCKPGTPVTGAMVDSPGTWGGLRVIDLTTKAQVGTYYTPRSRAFPPPDLGVYSVHHAVANANQAYVAWNSDGLRILDLSNPAAPTEIGHFVPPDTPDPSPTGIPAKAYVVGVADAGCNVVITDINSGLYVVAKPGPC